MKRILRVAPYAVGASIIAAVTLWTGASQVIRPTGIAHDAVVAETNSKKITYAEIAIKPEALEPLGQNGWDTTRIRDYQKASEFDNLKRIMEETIVSEAMQKWGVKPSPEAVEARAAEIAQKYYGKPRITEEDAQAQNNAMQSMNRLVQTWQNNPAEGEALYKKEFSRQITPDAWEDIKKRYATPEALEALRRRQPTVNAKAMNDWIRQKAAQQVAKQELLKKLRDVGEIKADEDYLDWLYRQLVTTRILRGDVIPYASQPGGAGPQRVPASAPGKDAQMHPEFNTPPVPSDPKTK